MPLRILDHRTRLRHRCKIWSSAVFAEFHFDPAVFGENSRGSRFRVHAIPNRAATKRTPGLLRPSLDDDNQARPAKNKRVRLWWPVLKLSSAPFRDWKARCRELRPPENRWQRLPSRRLAETALPLLRSLSKIWRRFVLEQRRAVISLPCAC